MDTRPRRYRSLLLTLSVMGALFALSVAPVWGSIFGEENSTLVQMVVQLLQIQKQMSDLNKVAGETADTLSGLARSYQQVNAGIHELRSYSFDTFLNDVRVDLYRQYPGFAKLEYASENLQNWDKTFASSPWTAYEAVTAVFGDVSAPLRDDIRAGRQNIDRELVLKGEAAGGLAAAYTAEQVTQQFDRQITTLTSLAQSASPAQAAQLSARANLMVAAQQSYVMRLLARAVRLHSVDTSLAYGARIDGLNAGYQQRDVALELARQATQPLPLIDFNSDDARGPLDPYAAAPDEAPLLDPYTGVK